jgi:rubrerythrin
MVKYRCKFCGYKTEKNTKPEPCPYCSKKNGMVEEQNARDILAES